MSLAAALRFEADRPQNSVLRKAFEAQAERIRNDEMMKEKDNLIKLEKLITLRSSWNENLEESSWNKRIQTENGIMNGEIRMASKAALTVRRVALKQLLEKEFQIWEKELALQGKTFFNQRI